MVETAFSLTEEEAAELFQSERISAALATFDYVLGDLNPDDPDREERTFDAMKAAIQKADHIARTGQTDAGQETPQTTGSTAPSPPLTQETTDGVGPSSCGGRG